LVHIKVGFLDFIVLPLFRAWVAVFPASQPMLDLIDVCRARWLAIETEAKEEAARRELAEDGDDDEP
jgi:hypothetical protein|tara:strand:+ start:656 stop:856 length:201 start_codon:yes stop_codon:yes gene_type:complete